VNPSTSPLCFDSSAMLDLFLANHNSQQQRVWDMGVSGWCVIALRWRDWDFHGYSAVDPSV
jgi:hypothetical protein